MARHLTHAALTCGPDLTCTLEYDDGCTPLVYCPLKDTCTALNASFSQLL